MQLVLNNERESIDESLIAMLIKCSLLEDFDLRVATLPVPTIAEIYRLQETFEIGKFDVCVSFAIPLFRHRIGSGLRHFPYFFSHWVLHSVQYTNVCRPLPPSLTTPSCLPSFGRLGNMFSYLSGPIIDRLTEVRQTNMAIIFHPSVYRQVGHTRHGVF